MYEAKYQLVISKPVNVELNHCNVFKAFTGYSNDAVKY